jgi:hypothetical protein
MKRFSMTESYHPATVALAATAGSALVTAGYGPDSLLNTGVNRFTGAVRKSSSGTQLASVPGSPQRLHGIQDEAGPEGPPKPRGPAGPSGLAALEWISSSGGLKAHRRARSCPIRTFRLDMRFGRMRLIVNSIESI